MANDLIKRIGRFLVASMLCFIVFCIVVFVVMFNMMDKKSHNAIRSIGETYMAGVSDQISNHFDSVVELRVAQAMTIDESVPLSERTMENRQVTAETLTRTAKNQNFDYIGFISASGEIEVIYGNTVRLDDGKAFADSIVAKAPRLTIGVDETGEKWILLALYSAFPMEDGQQSKALICGAPVSFLAERLNLEEDKEKVYSFLVEKNGDFIYRTKSVVKDNYFDRVNYRYESVDDGDPQIYIEKIKYAMDAEMDYTANFVIDGEQRRLYMTPLNYCDWYLFSFMPFGEINRSIDSLSSSWTKISFGACVAILLMMLLIFWGFLRQNSRYVRLLEEARRSAQKANRAKSEFLSHMSHDIRTPMNAIVGMTEIAIKHRDDDNKVDDCLKKIMLSSQHLMSLINDVLDMSKIESGKMVFHDVTVSLKEIFENIESIVRVQSEKKNQNLNFNVHDFISDWVVCDPVRVNQVIMNIVSNAIKFTADEGNIVVEAYQEEVAGKAKEVRLHIIVSDTGIGMSPEFLEHIFDSFSREDKSFVRSVEGTGLGMAISSHIIKEMDGKIDVWSHQGVGSKFHVTVNLPVAEAGGIECDGAQDAAVIKGKRVLVAEDNELNWEIAQVLLNDMGLETEHAANGRECVEKFLFAREFYYDFILMDLRMPVMDGYEATLAIRALPDRADAKKTPIIAMSADAFSEDVNRSLEVGMNMHMSKPLDVKLMEQVLVKYAEPS